MPLLDEATIRAAKAADPRPFLERLGYDVADVGKEISVRKGGAEEFRINLVGDRYLFCDRAGERGGDNIDLFRKLMPDFGWRDVVLFLAEGGPPELSSKIKAPAFIKKTGFEMDEAPLLPPFGGKREGRAYLSEKRKISLVTIDEAERQGFLSYTFDSVLFLGRGTDGKIRYICRRLTRDSSVTSENPAKSDLLFSQKKYAPVLRGDPSVVWIVEGGADALAAWDLAKMNGHAPPTVVVSGGGLICDFINSETVRPLLLGAEKIYIAGDNEDTPEKQERMDRGHARQRELILGLFPEGAAGEKVTLWTPPPERGKDVADFLFKKKSWGIL